MSEEITFDMIAREALESHENIMYLHARALACHCECLGMNAENCFAMCIGKQIPYGDDNYLAVMQKWGLINEKGDVKIDG